MEPLAGQRVLPSTEKELQLHLERKAKREADRLLTTAEKKQHKQEHARLAAAAQQAKNAAIMQTFAKRANEGALAAGETAEAAEATATTAAADAKTAFAENATQELVNTTSATQRTKIAVKQPITSWRELQPKGDSRQAQSKSGSN